jgi:hypothetical protein
LHGVPWVLLICPCFGVAYSIRSTRDEFMDEVGAFPWRFQLRRACLLETKYKVARLERPFAYPSILVVAEALLVDCRTGKGDISSLVMQVSGIFECLLGVFFDVSYHARCTVMNIGGSTASAPKSKKNGV